MQLNLDAKSETSWGKTFTEKTEIDVPGGGQLVFDKGTELTVQNVGGTVFDMSATKPINIKYADISVTGVTKIRVDADYNSGVKIIDSDIQNIILKQLLLDITRNRIKI